MHVLALEVDLRLPQSQSLKDKRAVVRHLLDGSRNRFRVSAAEIGQQDKLQRGLLGFAVVASSAKHADEVIGNVEDYIWSHPELEVVSMQRTWLESDN